MASMSTGEQWLDLYDFRQRVAALYRERNVALERGVLPSAAWERFRAIRDDLFAHHPQSALDEEQRRDFRALDYFPYDDNVRVDGTLATDGETEIAMVGTSGEDEMPMTRVGKIRFVLGGEACALTLYWIDVYGGGLFLPFRDRSAPRETYGGGRYLIDTVKGSDFPQFAREGGTARVTLDFNYAYNPSCAYHYRWACPLAPPENHLPVAVRAGERVFSNARDPR
jgi:uncharacterized protein (DUF1684 family)